MKNLSLIDKLLTKLQYKSSVPKTNAPVIETNSPGQKKDKKLVLSWMYKMHSPLMILISISTLTGLISHRFYNIPELAVDTISPTKVIAPGDGSFIDQKTTDEKREAVSNGSVKVYQENKRTSQELKTALANQLAQINDLRKLKQDISKIDPSILPISVQLDLSALNENRWQEILLAVNAFSQGDNLEDNDRLTRQLLDYKTKVTPDIFNDFLSQLQIQRREYQEVQAKIANIKIGILNETEKKIVLNLDQKTWERMNLQVTKAQNLILTQGIYDRFTDEMRNSTISLHLQEYFPPSLNYIGVKLLTPHLKTNLMIDNEKTIAQVEEVAQGIEPVVVSIKEGDVIVNAGEKISREDFVLLDNFNLSRRRMSIAGVVGSGALVTISVLSFVSLADRLKKKIRWRDQILLLLLTASVPTINLFNPNYNSLPAVGLLTSTFYGPTLAVTQVVLVTGLSLFQNDLADWELFIPSIASGLVASFMASRLHSREELAFLGGGIALTQGSVYFIVSLLNNSTVGLVWYAMLPGALWSGTIGLTYTILALGISPYLERLFDLITPIRLAELSNPNRPLLKRLATEAPGTFQHTMFVATLAEAAARRLHCNVELVRAGTLYHDIGKMHDPLGFIENQMGGVNKHDQINDPWKSALIIKKHVTEGIVMARKCGLPQAIRDFIPQHQGSLLISYFYFQAQKEVENNPQLVIDESNFRYQGPTPQSRETAIVMLADGCEAALRSLKGATPDQAIAMVNKIFKARWRDHQLDDSGLKYEELPIIGEVFVNVWQQFNHERLVYPPGALDLKPKTNYPQMG